MTTRLLRLQGGMAEVLPIRGGWITRRTASSSTLRRVRRNCTSTSPVRMMSDPAITTGAGGSTKTTRRLTNIRTINNSKQGACRRGKAITCNNSIITTTTTTTTRRLATSSVVSSSLPRQQQAGNGTHQQQSPQVLQQQRKMQQQRQSKKGIHTSTAVTKSTTSTCDFVNSAPSIMKMDGGAAKPSFKSLRSLFVASAIPMVGFGFMDNLVMIQAGQYIDSTLGVTLGLATMTAAAAGQVVSDVSGVVFGGTLERFLIRMSFIQTPNLSSKQRQLPICRNIAMAGAVVGVICGCCLGACTLLLVDLEARNRIERANQLREIVTDMITPTIHTSNDEDDDDDEHAVNASHLPSETCTIYLASSKYFDLDDENDTDGDQQQLWRTRMKLLQMGSNNDNDSANIAPSQVRECAVEGKTIVSPNRDYLYVPILEGPDNVLAVIEFRHSSSSRNSRKQTTSESTTTAASTTAAVAAAAAAESQRTAATVVTTSESDGFTDMDVRTAKVMARHIAIFMNRIVE